MVSRDKIKKRKEGKDDKPKKDSKSKKKRSSGGSTEAFKLDKRDRVDPDDSNINERSRELAKSGELNYDADGDSYGDYKRRQVREVEELHEDMVSMAKKYSDDIAKYTLVMHAVLWNYANNRVGIAQVLMDNYGKTEKVALNEAEEICRKAGEAESFMKITNLLSRSMVD